MDEMSQQILQDEYDELKNKMKWIKCSDQKAPSYIDILVSDGERCWIAQTFDNIDVFFDNSYGAPFIKYAKPTHWMPLPENPE